VGRPSLSSTGGAPWNGLTVTPPANSAQGKDPQGLDEARRRVVGGKRGQEKLGKGGHLLGSLQRASALPCSLQREGEGRVELHCSVSGEWRKVL
jgi:hypothetical protein